MMPADPEWFASAGTPPATPAPTPPPPSPWRHRVALCVAVLIVCVVAIFAYGYVIRTLGVPDVLAREFYHHPICQHLDGWSASHFLLFALLGYLCPGQYLAAGAVGVGWEIFETALGQHELKVSGARVQLIGDTDSEGRPVAGDAPGYWYGKESDILMDLAGYIVGRACSRHK
jgi:hypothetical protein